MWDVDIGLGVGVFACLAMLALALSSCPEDADKMMGTNSPAIGPPVVLLILCVEVDVSVGQEPPWFRRWKWWWLPVGPCILFLCRAIHIGSRCWCHFLWCVKLVSLIESMWVRLSCCLPSVGLPVGFIGLPVGVPVVPVGMPIALV